MILPDVNVLIYAFRPDLPQHSVCHTWLTEILAGDVPFGLSTQLLSALIRITTNSRAFQTPSTIEEAFHFCEFLRAQPGCHIVEPGERHWAIFKRLCLESGTRGSRVADAWFAALAIESGCEWITFDRDYARFPGLRWRTPG